MAAAQDTEIRGQKIKKGDWLMLCYASANRDEEVFDTPFEFDIDRRPNKHVAFGYGLNVCLGQHLAKMEIKILLETLIPRLKFVRLAGARWMLAVKKICAPALISICNTDGTSRINKLLIVEIQNGIEH